MTEELQLRILGDAQLPTLVYLPGAHGDWTLTESFRAALVNKVRLVEFTYPRTTTWSLADHASAVARLLDSCGIHEGWLLGESFGSQIAWLLLAEQSGFRPKGLILAGGFPRHPAIWEARLALAAGSIVPHKFKPLLQSVYVKYARFRHPHAPGTSANLQEFLRRRSAPGDSKAIRHRVYLVARNNPNAIARSTSTPIYALSGFFDPVVPWPLVQFWLRRNCPSFCGSKIILPADHNVLATAPKSSAQQVFKWMTEGNQPTTSS